MSVIVVVANVLLCNLFSLMLISYYNVPSSVVGTGAVQQGIAAFSDYYSEGALQQFDQFFGVQSDITASGVDCFPDQCTQYESDLDVQVQPNTTQQPQSSVYLRVTVTDAYIVLHTK